MNASAQHHSRTTRCGFLSGSAAWAAAALAGCAIRPPAYVIDHCANVRIDGKVPPADWREGLQLCADQPNVFMKVSGLVEGTGRGDGSAPRELTYYRLVLDAVWHAFGEDRLLFGSNWPVSVRFAPLATVHAIVAKYFATQGAIASPEFFQHNAHRVYL